MSTMCFIALVVDNFFIFCSNEQCKGFYTFTCKGILNNTLYSHFKFINAHILEFELNIYVWIIYIINGLFCDIMLDNDLWLDIGCDYTYVIKIILIVNVNYNYFIISNWNHKLTFFF
jgi:hypothetical protein